MSFSVVIFPTSLGMLPVKLFHMKSLKKEQVIQVSKNMLGNSSIMNKFLTMKINSKIDEAVTSFYDIFCKFLVSQKLRDLLCS